MLSEAEVRCINKQPRNDPYHRITHIGGNGWRLTLDDAIGKIERNEWRFYVQRPHKVYLIVARAASGRKYLRTTADKDTPDNLLALPECV